MNALSTAMFVSVLLLLVLMNTLPDMRNKRKENKRRKVDYEKKRYGQQQSAAMMATTALAHRLYWQISIQMAR